MIMPYILFLLRQAEIPPFLFALIFFLLYNEGRVCKQERGKYYRAADRPEDDENGFYRNREPLLYIPIGTWRETHGA